MPRITLTSEDSLFCATFFHKLHAIEATNFSSLQYFDRVVKDIFPIVYCATDREASCLGVFLKATFEPLKRWRFDKHLYEKEAASKSGFSVAIGSQARCSYDQYCTVFFKWYDKITKIALHCLDQYQDHGRACLLVLIKLDGVYPARKRVNALLMDKLDILKKQEDMKDLQAMAQRYHTLLNKRKDSLFDDAMSKRHAYKAAKEPSPDRAMKTNSIGGSSAGKIGPSYRDSVDEPVESTPMPLLSSVTIAEKRDADISTDPPLLTSSRKRCSTSMTVHGHVDGNASSKISGNSKTSKDVNDQLHLGTNAYLKAQEGIQSHSSRIAKGRTSDSKKSSDADSRVIRGAQDDCHGSSSLPHRNRSETTTQSRGRPTERHSDRSDRKKQTDTQQTRAKDLSPPLHVTKLGVPTRESDQHPKRPRNDDATGTTKRNRPGNQNDAEHTSSKRGREEEKRRGGGRR